MNLKIPGAQFYCFTMYVCVGGCGWGCGGVCVCEVFFLAPGRKLFGGVLRRTRVEIIIFNM